MDAIHPVWCQKQRRSLVANSVQACRNKLSCSLDTSIQPHVKRASFHSHRVRPQALFRDLIALYEVLASGGVGAKEPHAARSAG